MSTRTALTRLSAMSLVMTAFYLLQGCSAGDVVESSSNPACAAPLPIVDPSVVSPGETVTMRAAVPSDCRDSTVIACNEDGSSCETTVPSISQAVGAMSELEIRVLPGTKLAPNISGRQREGILLGTATPDKDGYLRFAVKLPEMKRGPATLFVGIASPVQIQVK